VAPGRDVDGDAFLAVAAGVEEAVTREQTGAEGDAAEGAGQVVGGDLVAGARLAVVIVASENDGFLE